MYDEKPCAMIEAKTNDVSPINAQMEALDQRIRRIMEMVIELENRVASILSLRADSGTEIKEICQNPEKPYRLSDILRERNSDLIRIGKHLDDIVTRLEL